MSPTDPPLVEGSVLEEIYEVGEHLAATPYGHLYAVLNTGEARPRRQLLLARPVDSEHDLRLPGRPPAPGSAIPALAAALDTATCQALVLDVAIGPLLADMRPVGDEELLAMVLAASGILDELRVRDASPAPLRATHLALTSTGLTYLGPVLLRGDSEDEVAVLSRLAREFSGSQTLWSSEVHAILARRAAANLIVACRAARPDLEVQIDSGWASDTGPHRREDEDVALRLGWSLLAEGWSETSELLALADGMGGHRNGAAAARLALQTLSGALLTERADETLRGGADGWRANDHVAEALRRTVQLASETVAALAKPGEDLAPGCTLALAWAIGRRLFTVGVGDSRVGLVRNGTLTWLTRDDRGGPGEGHYLTQCLGQKQPLRIEVGLRLLQPGDRVVLCCDGVWEVIDEATILKELNTAASLQAAAEGLIVRAIAAGSTDNVTAVVATVRESASG